MVNSPIGKSEYHDFQQKKAEQDFVYQTNQRLQNLSFSIEQDRSFTNELSAKLGSLETECKNRIDNAFNTCAELVKNQNKIIDILEKSIKLQDQQLTDCKKTLDITQSNLLSAYKIIDKMLSSIDDLTKKYDALHQDVYGQIDRQNKMFDQKLRDQKQEILAMPSGIPELRKSLDQKVEIAELNGQNAILRTSNNERQIMLIEKKIENLYQLIKSIDLTQKES